MAKHLKVWASIGAKDQTSGVLSRIGARFKTFSSGMSKSLGGLGRIGNLGALGGILGIGGGLSLAGAGKALAGIVDAGDALGELTERIGFGVEAFQELQYAAERAGVPAEEFAGAMAKMNKGIGLARAGTGPLVSLLGKVAPALLEQVKAATSNEEAFRLLTEGMRRVQDPAKRAALAAAIFGRGADKMALLAGRSAEEIEALRKEARDLGIVMSGETVRAAGEIDDRMIELKASVRGVGQSIAGELMPALIPYIGQLRDWISDNRVLIRQRVVDVVRGVARWLASVDWQGIGDGIKTAWGYLRSFVDAIGGAKNAIIGLAALKLTGLIASLGGVGAVLGPIALAVGSVAFAVASANAAIEEWRSLFDFRDRMQGADKSVVEFGKRRFGTSSSLEVARRSALGIIERREERAAAASRGIDTTGMSAAQVRDALAGGTGTSAAAPVFAVDTPGAQSSADVTVRFEGAPAGMRVEKPTAKGGAKVRTRVGYRSVAADGG